MKSPDDCRQHAQECVELAQSADPVKRARLLSLAQSWLRLADEAAVYQGAAAELKGHTPGARKPEPPP
jgi:hypothetical protein